MAGLLHPYEPEQVEAFHKHKSKHSLFPSTPHQLPNQPHQHQHIPTNQDKSKHSFLSHSFKLLFTPPYPLDLKKNPFEKNAQNEAESRKTTELHNYITTKLHFKNPLQNIKS